MKIGVYPGTFDPVTNGHIDIIKRSKNLFDKLYVVIPNNTNKKPLFSLEERMELLKEVLKDEEFVEVTTTDLLTVDFAKKVEATAMLRYISWDLPAGSSQGVIFEISHKGSVSRR